MRGAKVEKKCVTCGKNFIARVADVKRGWAKSCSKSCAATQTNKKTGNYQRYIQGKTSNYDDEYLDGVDHLSQCGDKS